MLDKNYDSDTQTILNFNDEYSEIPNLYHKKRNIEKNKMDKNSVKIKSKYRNNSFNENIVNKSLKNFTELKIDDKNGIFDILMKNLLIFKKEQNENEIIKEKNRNKFYYINSKVKDNLFISPQNTYGRKWNPEFIKDMDYAKYRLKNNWKKKINNKNKNIKSKKSSENVKVNEYSLINNKKGGKNLNRSKKMINTDINLSSKMFNKKNVIKSTGNISSKNILENNYKINSLKKHIIDKKGIKNNNATKQDIISKRMKVESIKIDLNLVKSPKNYLFISQEKTTAENYKLNEKNNLTLRVTDTTKFKNNNRFSELNTAGQNEMSELNQSFRTSFSLYKYKSRSLSKKREERKRSKLNNLDLQYDSEENNKKLNNILISLSNLNSKNEKKYEQKSEPKRLIDRIRKYKKLQKL